MDVIHRHGPVRRQVPQIVACLLALGFGGMLVQARTVRHPSSRDGIKLEIKPAPHGVAVIATVANRGRVNASLAHGGQLGVWRLFVFDTAGRPVHPTAAAGLHAPPRISAQALKPGMAASKRLDLRQYFVGAGRGTFYVFVERYVGVPSGKYTDFSVLRSPVLRATLRRGMPPQWKFVRDVPRAGRSAANRASITPPPFPKHQIPTTGPIATLAQMARAVKARDLTAVRKLCYHGHHAPEPFYVALAAQAIAAARCTAAAEKRFGVNPWPHLTPSPYVFDHILAQLNLHSLRVHGATASVGVLWFDAGKFVPFPSFGYHFRSIHGRWRLDSWATQSSAPNSSARSYRLNVERNLKDAQAFDGLARDLAAGKFANLGRFRLAFRRRFAAVSDWFMLQSMKNDKQWMKANAWLVKRIEKEEKAAKKHRAQTQP